MYSLFSRNVPGTSVNVRAGVTRRSEECFALPFPGCNAAFRATVLARSSCVGKRGAMAARRSSEPRLPRNAHDSLFRAALEDPGRAADFLRCHLPARIRRDFADEPPEILDASFVDDSLGNQQSDRLLRVKLRNGGRAYVHAVIEHASSVDPSMAFRLLRYRVRVWEREMETTGVRDRLPPVYAVVVYHGKARWTAPRSVLDMVDGPPALRSQLRGFGYQLRDIARMRSDRLAEHPELKGVLLTLKYEYRDRVAPRVVLRIEELVPEETKLATQNPPIYP